MAEPRRVRVISQKLAHCPDVPCSWHGKVPSGAVYIGRGMPGIPASPYANPFKGPNAAEQYRTKVLAEPEMLAGIVEYVGDNDVACWCRPDRYCHGDVILEFLAAMREPYSHEDGPA